MAGHLYGGTAMGRGVQVVKPVGKDADGVKAIAESFAVGADVYAVGQPAYDQNVRA